MRLAVSVMTLVILLAATAGAGAAAGATEAVSLGAAEETGPEPAPFLEPAAVGDPVSFKVTYTATPVQPILISAGLNCIRGAETPGVPENLETATPPVSISLTAPASSDSCSLSAFAETPASGVFGTVRIEAEAIKTAKPQPTTPPPVRKKCKKGKRLKHGKCVRVKKKHHPGKHK